MDKTISIAQLATLLTAAGVALYVLGLIGLAVSVYRTFAETWATAWYAVSLMPRTVVAGQGVRIWRRSWVLAVIPLVVGLSIEAIHSVIGWFLKTFIGGFSGRLQEVVSVILATMFVVIVRKPL